jgi:Leucine-rich repeat (LRR) protein
MEVQNTAHPFNNAHMIMRATHTRLFAFTHLTLDSFLVERIRSEAHFLFAGLDHLTLLEIDTADIASLTHTINQFEACTATKSLKSVTLEFAHLYEASELEARLANVYNIKSLRFKPRSYFDMPRLVAEYSCFGHQLKELTFFQTEIKQIESALFEHFPRLHTLSFSFRNSVEAIEPGAFLAADSLLKLDISASDINLASNTFAGLTNLRSLKLKVKRIEAEAFNGLARLTHLDMSASPGPLGSIPASLFRDLCELKELDLSDCCIESIEPDAFDRLSALDKLNISNNRLKVFRTKCTPRILNAFFNQLTTVVFEADDLSKLEEVDLSFNKLQMTCFDGLFGGREQQVGVRVLNLGWNLVSGVEVGAFGRMQALRQLTLYGNNVSWIRVGAFDGLRELLHLNVAVQSTRMLRGGLFAKLAKLQTLEVIKNTQICEFTSISFRAKRNSKHK